MKEPAAWWVDYDENVCDVFVDESEAAKHEANGCEVRPLYFSEWKRYPDNVPDRKDWYAVVVADPDDIGWSTDVSWRAFWNGGCFDGCDPVEDGQPVTHFQDMPQPPKH